MDAEILPLESARRSRSCEPEIKPGGGASSKRLHVFRDLLAGGITATASDTSLLHKRGGGRLVSYAGGWEYFKIGEKAIIERGMHAYACTPAPPASSCTSQGDVCSPGVVAVASEVAGASPLHVHILVRIIPVCRRRGGEPRRLGPLAAPPASREHTRAADGEVEADADAAEEDGRVEDDLRGERRVISMCNQCYAHVLSMYSACTQHVLSMCSACTQHVIGRMT